MSEMSFIAEYSLSNHPIMRTARRRVPEVTIEVEDEQSDRHDGSHLIFRASGATEALERFFEALADDRSVDEFERLSTVSERCLFRVRLTPEGERGMTYTDAFELGITFLDIGLQAESVRYRAHFPSREALAAYRERCDERELAFSLRRLYRSEDDAAERYDLTPRQADVLRRALERGYFDVPRKVSAEELAEEFEISSQALSALLRRGQRTILRDAFDDEE
ncbi:bacterio-opsin activator HTH domain-containing protein [Natronococcus amylolyticus DSM 10524]|uniref:Bacterio-opsin activator HTH domain-containing protein n=2 Tax=Natronococcus amylolyticus TaxID=44470 RepID=L9XFL0_9EURY|nr:bacterio-opsin activator HTH domain-containing protein [Natronococcus amylolyticus DSM 10524]